MNFLAILLAAVAYIVIGMIWYGPLFGKLWIQGMNFSAQKMKKMKQEAKKSYPGMIVNSLVMAFVLATLLNAFAITSFQGASILVFWVWLGFIVTIQFGSVLWEGKAKSVFLITIGNYLAVLLAMAAILVAL